MRGKPLKSINKTLKALLLSLSLIFLVGCRENEKISENDIQEIGLFIESFYLFINNNPKSDDIYEWFLNEKIEFYIQDNSRPGEPLQIVTNNSGEMFLSIKSGFMQETGQLKNKAIKKIIFEKQPYDIPQSDLFIINYHMAYEYLQTDETFFIKKENISFRIYWYFINYNSL